MRVIRSVLLLAVLVAIVVGGTNWISQRSAAKATAPANSPRPRPAPAVRTAIADETLLVEQVTLPAEVRASATADIVSRVSGRLGVVGIKEGSQVRAGAVVARIIDPEAELAVRQADAAVEVQRARLAQIRAAPRSPEVAQAEANVSQAEATVAQSEIMLAQARRELARTQQLFNDGLIARANVDRAQTDVERAQADVELARARVRAAKEQVSLVKFGPRREDVDAQMAVVRQAEVQADQARARLRELRVTSPISGVVTRVNVESGSVISSSTVVATVATIRPVEIHVPLPEMDLPRLKDSSIVKFKAEAMPDRLFEGKVARIAPALDSGSRTARLVINAANTDNTLKPGMFARATVVFEERQAIVIPSDAIVRRGESAVVFVVKDDTVEERPVTVGYVEGNRSEIKEGLTSGETIVTVGQQGLRDGMKVRSGAGGGPSPAGGAGATEGGPGRPGGGNQPGGGQGPPGGAPGQPAPAPTGGTQRP